MKIIKSKKVKFFLVITILFFNLIIFSGFVSGIVTLGNKSHSIGSVYSPAEKLSGWINASFNQEPVTSRIASSLEGGINLLDFLKLNNANFSCTPKSCEKNYELSEEKSLSHFSLGYLEEKTLAFLISGQIKNVNNLTVFASVSNQKSCINPLEIDVLDDESVDWKSDVFGSEFVCVYERGTGCFNIIENPVEVAIGQTPFCERITLTPGSKFRLGAWVKKEADATTWESGLLKMYIYSLNSSISSGTCSLTSGPSANGGEVSCALTNFKNEKLKDYHVCIKATKSIAGYKIQSESVNPCGFHSNPGEQIELFDYYIFAKGAKFGNIGSFALNADEDDIEDYLETNYNNSCSTGCIIPIKFRSFGDLDVDVTSVFLSYDSSQGGIELKEISDAVGSDAKINSGFLKLDLSRANLTLPEDFGDYDVDLNIRGVKIFNESVEVSGEIAIRGLYPTIVAAGKPIDFILDLAGKAVSYDWDFGDGSIVHSSTNETSHTYLRTGQYTISVEVESESGVVARKSFTVSSVSPNESLANLFSDYERKISVVEAEISTFPSWYKEVVKEQLELEKIKIDINSLETRYESARTDSQFIDIILNLTKIKVPVSINETGRGEIPWVFEPNKINLDKLKSLGAGEYSGRAEEYNEFISGWFSNNIDSKLNFKYIRAYYDDGAIRTFGVFTLTLNPVKEIENFSNFLVIEGEGIVVRGAEIQELEGGVGLAYQTLEDKTIEFFFLDEVSINELKAYLSPSLGYFQIVGKIEPCNYNGVCEDSVKEDWKNCRADCKPYGIGIVIIIVIVILGVVAYVVLNWWYVSRYERHLFKNRNDVFNIVNFINHARSQNMSERDIKEKLNRAGWNKEQINYALKKAKGQKIIPLEGSKIISSFKRK